MNQLLKSCLFQNKYRSGLVLLRWTLMQLIFVASGKAQIVNFVSNGSFESLNSNSVSSLYNTINYWQPIDTNKYCDYLASLLPAIGNAPYALGFQYPRSGNNYILSVFFYGGTIPALGYPRNRLKEKLKPNVTYCAKYHIVNTNHTPLAIDSYGMYFADSNLDTIKYCNSPLTYLNPQIQTPSGNIFTDTLYWLPVTGTFVATGTEKYMVLGNFRGVTMTNTLLINPTYSTANGCEICIDDVSCIELNLPAFAGRDTTFFQGDSLFLGREPDVGIDEACIWYKLPGTIPIDTIAGFWIKPTATCTYVVRQEICGLVKWDTVTIYQDAVGLQKLKIKNEELKIFPVPASEDLELKIIHEDFFREYTTISFYNNLGMMIREEEILFKENSAKIKVNDLPDGAYSFQLTGGKVETIRKRFLLFR
jgi:hypothetical protein